MADRVLGLAGPGSGPWVCAFDLAAPRAKVVGLLQGVAKIFGSVSGKSTDEELVAELDACGSIGLKFFPFYRCEYHGPDKTFVLTFHTGKRADAIQ